MTTSPLAVLPYVCSCALASHMTILCCDRVSNDTGDPLHDNGNLVCLIPDFSQLRTNYFLSEFCGYINPNLSENKEKKNGMPKQI